MQKSLLQSKNLKVVQVPIGALKPNPKNPRVWSNQALENLKESMRRHGFVEPVIANSCPKRNGQIIGGHMRSVAARELGYKKIPVVWVRIDDPDKEMELNLRLNRNTGEFNFEMLKEFDPSFLLEIGFDDKDLSETWDDLLQAEDDDFIVEEEIKKIKIPKTKTGELYQLGGHRLICGDSTDPNVVKRLVGSEKIDVLACDPPYNINLNYDKGLGGKKNYGGTLTNDCRSDEDYRKFLKKTIENGLAVTKKDCHAFYFCSQRYIGIIQSLFSELGLENKKVCIWVKNNQNPTVQVAFNCVYEPVVYAVRGKPYLNTDITKFNEILNKEIETGNRGVADILDYLDIWLIKRLPTNQYFHPTEKSPTLYEKPFRRCTKIGDRILDLFAGSGSVMVAAHQLKRKAFLCELEPIFCDLIISRYEKLTGQKAVKIG
ncbi:MAG: DNA modification methylase [Patescibacteria group bacterium]